MHACLTPCGSPSKPRAGTTPIEPWLCAYTSNHVMLAAGAFHDSTAPRVRLAQHPTLLRSPCPRHRSCTTRCSPAGEPSLLLQPIWAKTVPPGGMSACAGNRRCSGLPQACSAASGHGRVQGKLNPRLLCLATSGPRRDRRPTWHPPIRQDRLALTQPVFKPEWTILLLSITPFHAPQRPSLQVHARSHW